MCLAGDVPACLDSPRIKDIDAAAAWKQHIRKMQQRFEQNPLAQAEPLKQSKFESYRFWTGYYRVDLDLIDQEIVVLRVGERQEVYKL